MERIKEAIEKARKERHGDIGNYAIGPATERRVIEDTNDESEHNDFSNRSRPGFTTKITYSGQSGKSHHVDYTKTRTYSFDEDELKSRRIVGGLAHDERSEPYRHLRSQILKKMRQNNWRTLAITSPTPSNGKTLTAINLAISLSQEVNQTVMLVDLDLGNPSIATSFGITVEKGLIDYVSNGDRLEEILFNPGYERLVVLPGTTQGHLTSEILSSPQLLSVIEEIRSRYSDRIIIFDLPALLDNDDALVFTPHADATLLVLEDGGSTEQDLKRSIELLKDNQLIGTIINKIR